MTEYWTVLSSALSQDVYPPRCTCGFASVTAPADGSPLRHASTCPLGVDRVEVRHG